MYKRGPKPSIIKPVKVILPGVPEPPKHLTKIAKAKWKTLVNLLVEGGLLSLLDEDAIALYCANYSDYVLARLDVETRGQLVTGNNGYEAANPSLKIAWTTEKNMKSMADMFGLSPIARSKLQLPEPEATIDPKWQEETD